MKKLIILLSPVFLSGCAIAGLDSQVTGSKPRDNASFYQHWVHSYEEQHGAKTPNIFRPAGSRQFPASRFRMEFAFEPNGQCNYKYLSPSDRHEMRSCVYTKIDNKVYIYDDAGKLLPQLSFTLLEPTSSELMRMTYGIAAPVKKDRKKK